MQPPLRLKVTSYVGEVIFYIMTPKSVLLHHGLLSQVKHIVINFLFKFVFSLAHPVPLTSER